MKIRAILFSAFAHFAFFSGAFFLGSRDSSNRGASNPLLEVPLGSVFVQDQGTDEKKSEPIPENSGLEKNKTPEGSFASRQTEREASNSIGTPSGETEPAGKIEPNYPAMSRKLGEEGEAIFELEIAPDGTVSQLLLARSSGYDRLDEAARMALREARFRPALQNGAAIPSRKKMRIEFRLK